jgi:hypothetical protein
MPAMAFEAWCPTCRRDVQLLPLDREPEIPFSLVPQMCEDCGREFTVDGYTLLAVGDPGTEG